MGRAPCCDKANVKRGPWSPEEDATLKNYLERHGTGGNWIALPRKAGLKRCGKSCRLRWLNYLRPDIKHGGFTQEEDHIICTLYKAIGSKWSVIASHLQGRTDNDVKNYWNTKLKKKLFPSFVPSPAIPTIKTESIPPQSFSMPLISSSFAVNYNGYFVSPSVEDITIPNKIVHDDGFPMDMGFGSYSDIFNFYGLDERIGEINTTSHGSSLLPSQGVYQNLTY